MLGPGPLLGAPRLLFPTRVVGGGAHPAERWVRFRPNPPERAYGYGAHCGRMSGPPRTQLRERGAGTPIRFSPPGRLGNISSWCASERLVVTRLSGGTHDPARGHAEIARLVADTMPPGMAGEP